ncbi:MAG: ketoacyl-ACP synthase III [Actinomycetota bacterium]|nr:ketoacyl-ACP synthase III [Actinomycetota bacterium]
MRSAQIVGVGSSLPRRIVTNDDLTAFVDTSDDWIVSRTGIRARRFAGDGETASTLAADAARRALSAADVRPEEIDLTVVATVSGDQPLPATAAFVQADLGLGGAAFDVAAACAGFIYGLAVATGMLTAGIVERALVIGSETMSRVIDPNDRATAVLFGDGAGAVVVRRGEAGEPGEVGPFDLGTDGELAELLVVPAGGSRRPASAVTVAEGGHWLRMEGKEVYRQAVRRMVESSRAVLARAGLTIDDVDRLVGHQANARILDAVADRLGIPPQRRVANVERYGNTSSASIPLALADAGLRSGQRILLTAFGAGLSWGSTLLRWPELASG